jgi:hypothetical protein
MNYTCSINGYTGGVSALPYQPTCMQANNQNAVAPQSRFPGDLCTGNNDCY